jgi:hypothetical protein
LDITWANLYYGTNNGVSSCGYAGNFSVLSSPFLVPWSWYTFFMYLSGTQLEFRVYNGSGNMNGTPYWTHSVADTAASFETTATYSCKGGGPGWTSLTPYEEVFIVTNGQHVPEWDFYFGYTSAAWWGSGSWTFAGVPNRDFAASCYTSPCPTQPHTYAIVYYNGAAGRILTLANLAFREYFSADEGYISAGGNFSISGSNTAQGSYCSGTKCQVSLSCTWPSGWAGGLSGQGKYVGVNADMTFYTVPPVGTAAGLYKVPCPVVEITTTPWESTTFVFYIHVS